MTASKGETERRGFLVRGRVQGVGFRWFTQRAGERIGLGGHVRNRRDGSVEVHAAGLRERLDEFEAALHRGPPGSRVDGVERITPDPRTPEDRFLMESW